MNKKYCIYKIINNKSKKVVYVGQHACLINANDDYFGSGYYIKYLRHYLYKNKLKFLDLFHKEIEYSNIKYKDTVDYMEKYTIEKYKKENQCMLNFASRGSKNVFFYYPKTKKSKIHLHEYIKNNLENNNWI